MCGCIRLYVLKLCVLRLCVCVRLCVYGYINNIFPEIVNCTVGHFSMFRYNFSERENNEVR